MADAVSAEKAEEQAHKVTERARQKAQHIIEEQKPKLEHAESAMEQYSPPVFMGLTVASIISSLVLFFRKSKDDAVFVGLWAPTFLLLGLLFAMLGMRRKQA